MSTEKIPKDKIIEQIKVLYELGDDGKYEIIKRTVWVCKCLLELGKSGKNCVDFHMDKGIKPLELGVGFSVALTETDDSYLSKLDQELKRKILADKGNLEMFADWHKLEEQNEGDE
ncbi:MAG: hypothetical protein QQN41_11455 [Nitrosopumilus sp.]